MAGISVQEQKWMNHLVIVRHAESQRNVGKPAAQAAGQLEYHGNVRDMDVLLTPNGQRQAEATGKYLAGSSASTGFSFPLMNAPFRRRN